MHRPFRTIFTLTLGAVLALTIALAPSTLAENPVERHGVWVDSLQDTLNTSSDLSPKDKALLAAAIRDVTPGAFAADADPADRKALDVHAEKLASQLSCQSYGQVLDGFGDLGEWMEANKVAVAVPECNCSKGTCSDGYFCNSIRCISEVGSDNNGRCKKGDPPDAAEPDGAFTVESL